MKGAKIRVTFILLLLVASLAAAQGNASTGMLSTLMSPDQAAFLARLQNETAGFNMTDEGAAAAFMKDRTLVVMGSNMDASEKASYEAAKAAMPQMANVTPVPDTPDALAKIDSGKYLLIVLVGGPSQNEVTKNLSGKKLLNETNTTYAGLLVSYGWTDRGALMMVVSDGRGYNNAAREGLKYSPLAGFVPEAYIPAVATGISAILLALLGILRTMFEFKALDIGRKGRRVGESSLMLGPINLMEPLAIAGASLVLGLSISWQYFGPTPDFLFWAAVNTFICLGAAMIHEIAHRLLALAFGFRVEYRIWPAGSALTLISSWLGNAFSVQGFLLEEIPENAAKWKVALMRIVGPLVSTAAMLFFALVNLFFPHRLFQMSCSISALWAMAEVFPFSGLDGKDLKDWNVFVWLFTFLMVAAAYVFVTFIL
jgi:hypothetical protein